MKVTEHALEVKQQAEAKADATSIAALNKKAAAAEIKQQKAEEAAEDAEDEANGIHVRCSTNPLSITRTRIFILIECSLLVASSLSYHMYWPLSTHCR